MYLAVDHLGWVALPLLRLLTGCALVAVLLLTLVRRRQPIAAFVVMLLVVVGLAVLLQDRPQTVSLVFIALLAAACERLWAVGRRPSLLLVAGLSLLWAQLHGLWVLAPGAFALVALGALIDRRRAPSTQLRDALLCAGASLAGVLNPIGPTSFLLPFTFRNSGSGQINEWASTTFTSSLSLCWGLLLCLIVWAWVRGRTRIAATELLWVFVWTVFGVQAMRNVGPSILFIAPVALRALERAGGTRLDRLTRDVSPRENRILAGMLAAVAAIGRDRDGDLAVAYGPAGTRARAGDRPPPRRRRPPAAGLERLQRQRSAHRLRRRRHGPPEARRRRSRGPVGRPVHRAVDADREPDRRLARDLRHVPPGRRGAALGNSARDLSHRCGPLAGGAAGLAATCCSCRRTARCSRSADRTGGAVRTRRLGS